MVTKCEKEILCSNIKFTCQKIIQMLTCLLFDVTDKSVVYWQKDHGRFSLSIFSLILRLGKLVKCINEKEDFNSPFCPPFVNHLEERGLESLT